MTTLADVLQDLRDEVANLDAVLARLDDESWSKPTPAVGWDIRDTVGHLADTDDLMFEGITGGSRDLTSDVQAAGADTTSQSLGDAVDAFTAWQMTKVRTMSGPEVYAWWRSATARLHDQLGTCDPAQKYPWGGNMLSPLSLCSARIMETWAHSLDVHDAVGKPYPDTDRIRHVAHLGLRALPYAFTLEGLEAPGAVRLELTSPGGERWTLGPDDARNVIRGTAGDWARICARRDRDGSAGRLQGEGPDVANVIANARAFL
jgi:uncharacterized protein (TIGR03084 family)